MEQATKPMSAREAAEYLGLSLLRVYQLARENEIPAYRPGGRKWYFAKKDLDHWVYGNNNARRA